MKALSHATHGGPEVLHLVHVPDPEPAPVDVVVRVRATAVNRLDVVQRAGWFTLPGFALPHIAGMDVAGEIIALGSDVHDLAIGQRVVIDPSMAEVSEKSNYAHLGDRYGMLGVIGATLDGGYAELCLAPASHVHVIPDHITDEAAAAFPTSYVTAWHALFESGGLRAGETVMVNAAASGISIAAIQLANRAGARVLANAGTDEKCQRAIAVGAAAACNNRTTDLAGWVRAHTDDRGVDLVFDHVGPALWDASLRSLAIRGRLVCFGNTTGDSVTIPSLGQLFHLGLRIIGSDPYRPHEFAAAWQVFCDASLQPVIDSTYPLAEAGAAQERLIAGQAFGKLLLVP